MHQPSLVATAAHVCSHHVNGEPHETYEPHNLAALDPELSGFLEVPGGASCDVCTYYQTTDYDTGLCVATVGAGETASVVQAKGHCSRWASMMNAPEVEEDSDALPEEPTDSEEDFDDWDAGEMCE